MENKFKQSIVKNIIKASKNYSMIENGDKIAVGVSGGKDSLLLLECLALIKSYKKINFELIAITINQGLPSQSFDSVREFANNLNVPYYVFDTDIFDIVFNIRKEKNPCSLCAKMRRGALCEKAKELGANKVALGHHADDLVETFMLSLLYEGRLSTFMPVSHMSRTDIYTIRPMMLVKENDIVKAAKDLPIVHNPCPANKHTNRELVKNILKEIKNSVPTAETNMLNAITHPERYNLFTPPNKS